MKLSRKGILLAVLQLAIVGSLAAKYAIDRSRFPRVGAQSVDYDPDLQIRGRYLSVRLRVDADRVYGASQPPKSIQGNFWGDMRDVYLYAENGHLVASSAPQPTGLSITRWRARNEDMVAALSEPEAYFLPAHAVDPSRRQQGDELWVAVTVPKKCARRPLRLAAKRGDE